MKATKVYLCILFTVIFAFTATYASGVFAETEDEDDILKIRLTNACKHVRIK